MYFLRKYIYNYDLVVYQSSRNISMKVKFDLEKS